MSSALSFSAIFTDHVVLQRHGPIPVWGQAAPGALVRVQILAADGAALRCGEVIADAAGAWLLRLPGLPAGGPFTLQASVGTEHIAVHDVLIGEVWLASGQSNMAMSLSLCFATDATPVIDGDLPQVRILNIKTPARLGRTQTVAGARWEVCNDGTLWKTSAVGGHFARQVHRALGVPVGLIVNAWGGTRVQAWTSREALCQEVDGAEEVAAYEAALVEPGYLATTGDGTLSAYETACAARQRPAAEVGAGDFHRGEFDDAHWPSMAVPSVWQDHGHDHTGIFWFRTEVTVPAAGAGRDLVLHLGAVDKHDETWVNGELVGATGWEVADSWCVPRIYRIPGRMVASDGRLVIAVRVRSHAFHGGLRGPAAEMRVECAGAVVPLPRQWRYHLEQDHGQSAPPAPGQNVPWGPGNPNSPYILYDSRLAPVIPFALAGVIWYQGEHNIAEAHRYRRMMAAMIRDWRRVFALGELPFAQVQLTSWVPPKESPSHGKLADLRAAQAQAAHELPRAGLAVIYDCGNPADVHPVNKAPVGDRLARWALAEVYGHPIAHRGPQFRSVAIEGDRLRVRFDHARDLATRDGQAPAQVQVAGSNRQFHPAQARLEGETMVAWSPEVPKPMAVRYAWTDDAMAANLVGTGGLPVPPFRSDG
jgi:sialate O-acetylesterase